MSEMEVLVMNTDGVGWVPLSELPIGERIALEIDIATTTEYKINCVVCGKGIRSGMGHSYCDAHKPNFPKCESCGCEKIGLYCSDCYTGRIATSPSGERYWVAYDVPRCQ